MGENLGLCRFQPHWFGNSPAIVWKSVRNSFGGWKSGHEFLVARSCLEIWAYVVFSRVGPQAGERKHSRIAVGRIAFSTDEILSRRRYREILSVRPTKSAFILRAVAAMEHSPRTWVSICTIISPIMLITYFPHHEDSGAN